MEKMSEHFYTRFDQIKIISNLHEEHLKIKINDKKESLKNLYSLNKFDSVTKLNNKLFKIKKYTISNNKEINLVGENEKQMQKLITQFDHFPIVEGNILNEEFLTNRNLLINYYKEKRNKNTKKCSIFKSKSFSCISAFCIPSKNKICKLPKTKFKEKVFINIENKNENKDEIQYNFNIKPKCASLSIVESKVNNIHNLENNENNEKNENIQNENYVSLCNKNVNEKVSTEKLCLSVKNPSNNTPQSQKQTKISSSNTTEPQKNNDKSPSKLNFLNSNLNLNNKIKKGLSSLSLFEPVELSFNIFNKQIDFFLTHDLLKCLFSNTKENTEEFILHSCTFTNTQKGVLKEEFLLDLILRSNFSLLLSKNNKIKFPLLLNGNVYFPNLTFFRANAQKQFCILENPLTIPCVLSQFAHEETFQDREIVDNINLLIIKEALTISDTLNYENIIVNLLNFESESEIFKIINSYIKSLLSEDFFVVKNITFILSYSYEGFVNFLNIYDLYSVLSIHNIKSRLFIE